MNTAIPWYLFDTSSSDLDEVIKIASHDTLRDKSKKLRCFSCQYVITDESQRISIEGSYSHNRTNPSGINFNFECFQNAIGCSCFGTATSEYSWFSGHKWQLALCSNCSEHLGWRFKGANMFFGLIAGRLIRDGD